MTERPARTEVLAYYFPQYHADPRNDRMHGAGWTEWQLLQQARPRFPGHRQPIEPAWGAFDESDPAWAAREIDLAADHGVTGFLFDWYWYEGKPFLQQALEEGFLQASNRDRLKFALMWANHDWIHLFPHQHGAAPQVLMPGAANRASFDALVDYVLGHYLHQPNYLTVNGAPYFSIYELGTFIAGLGGLEAARAALADFRQRVRAAGFPGLHLNAVVWGVSVLPSEVALERPEDVIGALGFDSATSYTWVHHFPMADHEALTRDYREAAQVNRQLWNDALQRYAVPYHPNVSVGWDSSPRTQQDVPYHAGTYPWHPVLSGNTPQAFEEALRAAQDYLGRPEVTQKIVTLNAWNEWTEGSYLLPDTVNGTAYLEAIRHVFAPQLSAAND